MCRLCTARSFSLIADPPGFKNLAGLFERFRKNMHALPELIGYLAALLTTASFLPQAILTIRTRDTASLSLSMYGIFTLGVALWLIYGIFLHNSAIIAANTVTLVLSASILYVKIYNKLTGREQVHAPGNP
jgi:MtN3 and saliva related transmembrane protein